MNDLRQTVLLRRFLIYLAAFIVFIIFVSFLYSQSNFLAKFFGLHQDDFSTALKETLLLQNYNSRIVLVGVMTLGLTGGIIGSFMLLRKRSLMSDAISHATLPGLCLAFLLMTIFSDSDGKSLIGLLIGAAISAIVGMLCMLILKKYSRLKEDSILGIILSVFFGAGIALMGVIQNHSKAFPNASAAGLENFILGKSASLHMDQVYMLLIAAIVVFLVSLLLYKEFKLLCFDQDFCGVQGMSVIFLDLILMALIVGVTVIGLKTVGIIMVIAMLIIPAAAARFWTEKLSTMIIIAAIIGGLSGYIGATLSAIIDKMPTGPTIVLSCSCCFILSMFFGLKRGLLIRYYKQYKLSKKVSRQNLLRAIYEWFEANPQAEKEGKGISFKQLLELRSWSEYALAAEVYNASKVGLIANTLDTNWHLTELGKAEASLIVRNHRLWEIYLITHADIATSRVDRETDAIEHVLGVRMVNELEKIVARDFPHVDVPPSPHPISIGRV